MFSFNLLSEGKLHATCPSITVTLAFPILTLLLALTTADDPITVAFVKLVVETSA